MARKRCAVVAVLLFAALAGCAGGTLGRHAELCADVVAALEPGTDLVQPERRSAVDGGVRIEWRDHLGQERWYACRFAGDGWDFGRFALEGVTSDREGELSEVTLFLLREYWLGRGGRAVLERVGADPWLYALQQGLNAVVLGALFGLLAVGYTLVWAVLARVNLAFGQFGMIAGYATIAALLGLAVSGPWPLAPALMVALVFAAAVGGAWGLATERVVFRPLRGLPTQAPLIATAGLLVFLEELVRIAQAGAEPWLPALGAPVLRLMEQNGFAVTISTAQLAVVALALTTALALQALLAGTPFGRSFRACADDVGAAELCGVHVERTIALTFALGGAAAGVGGYVFATYYGGVGFTVGTLIGFKALTAAVVGGLGSVGGAFAGGLIVGGLETIWAGYFSLAYKDVAVFALLAAVLALRPHGLLGRPSGRGD